MKKTLFLIVILLTINSCSKKDTPTLTPLQQLPKATKTGANTAGCLVNGEAFLPKGFSPSGNLTCFYINQKDFSLNIFNKSESKAVNIASRNLELQVHKKYILKEYSSNSQQLQM